MKVDTTGVVSERCSEIPQRKVFSVDGRVRECRADGRQKVILVSVELATWEMMVVDEPEIPPSVRSGIAQPRHREMRWFLILETIFTTFPVIHPY